MKRHTLGKEAKIISEILIQTPAKIEGIVNAVSSQIFFL